MRRILGQDDRDILEEYELEYSKDKERKMKDKTLLRVSTSSLSTFGMLVSNSLCSKKNQMQNSKWCA